MSSDQLIRYLRSGEARVILQNLPTNIRGFCYNGADGQPFIVLNARLTREQNRISSLHEASHILSGELDDEGYVEYD